MRSYRDLPLRYFELGTVNRHEKSGVLHGLMRVREFTQDDAHIICTPEQLQGEIAGVLGFIKDVMGLFGFAFTLELSTRPEKSIGSDEDWELATGALREALDAGGFAYAINEGDGAFYGPKIDVKLKDAIGRSWQCATIQCDFTLPERFDLTYIARGRPAEAPGHDPPRRARLHRALHRGAHRALRRGLPLLARAGPGRGPDDHERPGATYGRRGRRPACAPPATGSRRTCATRRSATRSARRSCRKCPSWLYSAPVNRPKARVAVRRREQGDVGALGLDEFLGLLNEQGGQRTVTVA